MVGWYAMLARDSKAQHGGAADGRRCSGSSANFFKVGGLVAGRSFSVVPARPGGTADLTAGVCLVLVGAVASEPLFSGSHQVS